MKSSSIKNLRLFNIIDEISQITYYGNDQEWYESKWKRLSGCGPTAVANIIYYFNQTNPDAILSDFRPTKERQYVIDGGDLEVCNSVYGRSFFHGYAL